MTGLLDPLKNLYAKALEKQKTTKIRLNLWMVISRKPIKCGSTEPSLK